MVDVGGAEQIDSKMWCLMTAHSSKERVKPENLEKAWKSLVHQPLTSRNLFLQAFDWYRGAFHFQDWYRLVTACAPRGWNLHIVTSRTYQFSPRVSCACFTEPSGHLDANQWRGSTITPCHMGGLRRHLSSQGFPGDGSTSGENHSL